MIRKDATKLIRLKGKCWRAPVVLPFGGGEIVKFNWYFYDVIDYRPPRKGEWFLSGGPVGVYLAHNDLNWDYVIVKPTVKARAVSCWEPVPERD